MRDCARHAQTTLRRRDLLIAAGAAVFGPSVDFAVTIATAHAAGADLKFAELYKSFGVRGLEFSDRLLALAGQQVTIRGFMAPPLKPETNFFVLTREPVALCPFCSSDAEWPLDIVVIYLKAVAVPTSYGSALAVTGRLEVGSKTDQETGFVSQIRLIDASFAPL